MHRKPEKEKAKPRSIALTDFEMDILQGVAAELNSSIAYACRYIIREYDKAVEKENEEEE